MGSPEFLIICGPSGAGKGTVIEQLLAARGNLWLSRSATTRAPRPREKEGIHYDFLTMDRFLSLRNAGELAEWNFYNGNGYGTPAQPLREALAQGKTCVFDIDINGARQLCEYFAGHDIYTVFLVPDSLSDLQTRLLARGDDPADVQKRLAAAKQEYAAVAAGNSVVQTIIHNPSGDRAAALQELLRRLDTGDRDAGLWALLNAKE